MSDPTVPVPAAAAPVAAPAQQPGAAPVNVTVNLPPDLLRMAGMAQPAAPAAPLAVGIAPTSAEQPKVDAPKVDPAPSPKVDTSSEATALQAQLSELKSQLRAASIRSEVERVALTGGAINAADVLKLVADELDVATDGRVIAKGDPRVTGEQHVARFLAARPHMLKPLVHGGGAGAPATVSVPAPAAKPDMSSNEGATALARKIAEARGFARPSTV